METGLPRKRQSDLTCNEESILFLMHIHANIEIRYQKSPSRSFEFVPCGEAIYAPEYDVAVAE